MARFDVVAFDADDTLWQNEQHFVSAQAKLTQLLARYHGREWIEQRLFGTEMRNLQHFGYGIKSFALSMIETAVELTEGRITGSEIQTVIDAAKGMLAADVELIEHVADTLTSLAPSYDLMLITKGDLLDQELKIERSGLAQHFRYVKIVSDKTPQSYLKVLQRHGIAAERFVMVGNSLRSDILPVLALNAHAVFVPHPLTWVHESAEPPPLDQPGYHALEHIGQLPALLRQLEHF